MKFIWEPKDIHDSCGRSIKRQRDDRPAHEIITYSDWASALAPNLIGDGPKRYFVVDLRDGHIGMGPKTAKDLADRLNEDGYIPTSWPT